MQNASVLVPMPHNASNSKGHTFDLWGLPARPKIYVLNTIMREQKDIFIWGQLILNVRSVRNPTEALSRVWSDCKRPPFRNRHVFSHLHVGFFVFLPQNALRPLAFSSRTSLKHRFFAKSFCWFYMSRFVEIGTLGLISQTGMLENAQNFSMLYSSLRRTRRCVRRSVSTLWWDNDLLTLPLNTEKTTGREELIFYEVAQGDQTNTYMRVSFLTDTRSQSYPLLTCQKISS